MTLREARAAFTTKTVRPRSDDREPPPVPPPAAKLARVKYKSPLGEMWAYVTPDPGDGKKHPAVLWAHGGFDFGIDAGFYTPQPADNDQSASQLRSNGIIVMYPSFRGAHDNPGTFELLLGEVDDYLAAADHLRGLGYVDPERIYFAGHSTGGTLVLLAAELTDRFRAAFAFGPVGGVQAYGDQYASFDPTTWDADTEWKLRAPLEYVADIRRPTFVIEGEDGNAHWLPRLEQAAARHHVPLNTRLVTGHDHFSVLAPQLEQLARTIAADDGRGDFAW